MIDRIFRQHVSLPTTRQHGAENTSEKKQNRTEDLNLGMFRIGTDVWYELKHESYK